MRLASIVLVLMLVMTDVPRLDSLFMLAIARSCCPGELERQQNKQQN
jgi:hypothetical protein